MPTEISGSTGVNKIQDGTVAQADFASGVGGKIIKRPIASVAKPGIISNNAANAKAAPENISYMGNSFFIICDIPALKVLNPSYLA